MRDFPDWRTEHLCEQHEAACLELLRLWQKHGDASHEGEVNDVHIGSDILRHRDSLAAELAVRHRAELGLRGMVLIVGENPGKVIGFTLGEAISPTQASILVEKTHPDYHGAPQVIFSEFCRLCWSDHPECNAGDDWGIPSLRFTKQSYRPSRLLSKYVLTRQSPVVVGGVAALDLPTDQREPIVSNPPAQMVAADPATAAERAALRTATLDDLPAILDIERICFAASEESFNKRQVRYLITSPRAAVTVATIGARVVGWSVGLVRQHRRSRTGRLYAVAVHPESQGKQLGRRLVEHTLEALAVMGIDRIFLEVRADNEPALALYQKIGFARHRMLPNYYGQGRHGWSMKLITAPVQVAAPLFADEAAMHVHLQQG
jgi:ribosomal-protein-alanine N-acetyltransferase